MPIPENASLTRLEPDTPRKPFNCENSDLNEFFNEDSIKHSQQLLAVTYALENEHETLAYFSVLNDSIRAGDTSNSRLKKHILKYLPFSKRGYKSHPAVKIGRFAVSEGYKRQQIGTELMDYIKGYFIDNNKTGCRFITVDANNINYVISFYQKNGFEFLTLNDALEKNRIMYFDLYPLSRGESPE
ncbi:MAG: GNAT family N-acetyltransferase [Nitrospirota bacterium]